MGEESPLDLGVKSSGMDDDAPLNLSLKPTPGKYFYHVFVYYISVTMYDFVSENRRQNWVNKTILNNDKLSVYSLKYPKKLKCGCVMSCGEVILHAPLSRLLPSETRTNSMRVNTG